MTEIVRVQPKYLHHRLDVRYNSPSAVNARMAIASSGLKVRPVGQLLELVCGPFGSTLTSDEHCPHGEVLLVQPTNLSGELFSDDTSWRITKNDLVEKGLKLYTEGTLLFARVGIYPHTGVLPQGCGLVTISSSMIAGIPVKSIDTYYLASFFQSAIGYQLLLAAQKVTAQPTIGTSEIGATEVPVPQELVQKYIGDKVRQAERLRAWAVEVQAQVRKVIPRYLNQVPSYEHKYFKSERSELSQLRLDASFYHPDYINLDMKLRTVGCSRLGTKCTQVKADWNKKAEFFSYFEIGGLNVANGTIEPTVVNVEDAPSRAKTGIQLGDVLVSTVRPNRKNVAFVSEDFSPLPMVATSGFSVLRFDSLESAAFYHVWLRTDDATHQLMRWNSGSAYPAIDDDVPLNILVPEFDEAFVSKWGEKVLVAHYALIASRKLVQVAKLVVEMLIDGQLTEQQLIDAQKALESDDNSLDREILGRLTTKGLDGDGDPLFADLDQLYDLLAQCQQMDE